jgi:hypothetical protein
MSNDSSLKPTTDECCGSGTRRVYFNRKAERAKLSLVVINFEGIIGEITKYPLFDPEAKHGIYLRKGAITGLVKLLRKFQVVMVSTLNESKIMAILNYFKTRKILFDGVYTNYSESILNNNSYFSYTQIFDDFESAPSDANCQISQSEPSKMDHLNDIPSHKVTSIISLIVCALTLENNEIKLRSPEELLYTDTVNKEKMFHVTNMFDASGGLDKASTSSNSSSDTKSDVPVTLLIPHMMSQEGTKCMCFTNIVTLIESLYIASAVDRKKKVESPVNKRPSYTVTTKHYSNDNVAEQKDSEYAPKPHFFVMNTISISPQNHFKKIQKRVYGSNLDASNTSWVHGFNSCLKYELFSVKLFMSHEPKLYKESIGNNAKALSTKIQTLKLAELNDHKSLKFDEFDLESNGLAMQLYKTLKSKNISAQKARQEYHENYFKSVNSIFDKKLTPDEDSCSDEEGKNEIKMCQIGEQSSFNKHDNAKEQNGHPSRSITRSREVPYRFIVTPGYLYESHAIEFIKEIS